MQINFRFKGGRKVSPVLQGNAISPPTVTVAKENTSSKTACNLCEALKYASIPAFTLFSTCCRTLPPFPPVYPLSQSWDPQLARNSARLYKLDVRSLSLCSLPAIALIWFGCLWL